MALERPPPRVVAAVESVVRGIYGQMIDDLRNAYRLYPGIRFTSWYRTPAHNAEVGGVESSQHLAGLAVDVVPVDREQRAKLAAFLRSARWTVIEEGDHLHAQVFKASPAVSRFVGWASRFA